VTNAHTNPFAARRGLAIVALAMTVVASRAGAQRPLDVPPPRGMVNDFAGVVDAGRAAQVEALARFVRERSGGEIAVVTLSDIGDREVGDVALKIGRDWKVGAKAEIGDARRNAGVVVLLVPKETSSDGRGHISIQTGQGVEGFIPDAVAGDIRREATPYLQRRDYGTALQLITYRLAERYAGEFGFTLDSAGVQRPARAPRSSGRATGMSPVLAFLIFVILVMALAGGRRSGCAWFAVGHALGSASRRDRWRGGGGGFGGGFGGGGGGFGGFGGGGGFSGGGSSGSW
jgi:uncharacterized protein